MIIHLISGPRNVSTALMYSFARRPDTIALDEPFYGFYLQHTGIDHPGREDILASLESNPAKILAQIAQAEKVKGHVFIKNMGHHLQGFDYAPISQYRNVFLIRDPAQMLISYAKVRESPTLEDIGLKQQAEVYEWLLSGGQQPLVVDGNEIRKNPAEVLSRLCERLGIPFTDTMLHWPAGPKPEDGVWAKYWYANVHQSTGFSPPDATTAAVPTHLQSVYEAALPYYQQLRAYSI